MKKEILGPYCLMSCFHLNEEVDGLALKIIPAVVKFDDKRVKLASTENLVKKTETFIKDVNKSKNVNEEYLASGLAVLQDIYCNGIMLEYETGEKFLCSFAKVISGVFGNALSSLGMFTDFRVLLLAGLVDSYSHLFTNNVKNRVTNLLGLCSQGVTDEITETNE